MNPTMNPLTSKYPLAREVVYGEKAHLPDLRLRSQARSFENPEGRE